MLGDEWPDIVRQMKCYDGSSGSEMIMVTDKSLPGVLQGTISEKRWKHVWFSFKTVYLDDGVELV